jgi:hypothetical protein
MNRKMKIPEGYYEKRSTKRSISFDRRVFLISTLSFGLLAAVMCFVLLTSVPMSAPIQKVFEFFGRIIVFPAVSLVVNKVEFLWTSKYSQLWFYLGLVFNCVFYGFLIERIYSWQGLDN